MQEQFDAATKAIEELEFKNMLSAEEDQFNAVLQITAGAGGTESCDWAGMLMRMYIMWSDKNGYKVSEQDFQEGDVAGVKTVTLQIEGNFAYGYLKGETACTVWCGSRTLTPMPSAIRRLPRFMFTHWLMILSKLR